MTRLRKAAKATAVAQMFNGASLLLSLVAIPLYLSWLGQERYGLLLTGLAFASYLMFADGGINWASMLLIAEANGREAHSDIAAIVRNSFPLAGCSALIVVLVVAAVCLFLRSDSAPAWLPEHPEFPGLLVAIGVSIVFNLGFAPFYNLLIGLQEAHIAAFYQGCGRLLGTLASLAIASTGASLGWVYGGSVAAALLAAILAAVHCRRRHPWAFVPGRYWESARIRQQLRTGVKSLVMQVGVVLGGTAPVLAISFGAGPQFVPFFSIPYTLLNAPLSILSTFSASLQPGYGEAMARGETQWIAKTVQGILRKVLVALGLLGVGFYLLAGPFVSLWTGGRIDLQTDMLGSVLAIATAAALLTVFRFALTGINRHREAALGDLVAGTLALVAGYFAVLFFGYTAIGATIGGVTALSIGWIFPRALRRSLDGTAILPDFFFWIRWLATTLACYGTGTLVLALSAQLPAAEKILFTGSTITITYLGLSYLLLRNDLHLSKVAVPSEPA